MFAVVIGVPMALRKIPDQGENDIRRRGLRWAVLTVGMDPGHFPLTKDFAPKTPRVDPNHYQKVRTQASPVSNPYVNTR